MKKIMGLLFALLTFFCMSISALAETKSNTIFVSQETEDSIESNLLNQEEAYSFIFETDDVIFDFNHIVPIYEIADYNTTALPTTLFEITEFTNRYMLPVSNSEGEHLGFVTLAQIPTIENLSENLKEDSSYIEKSQNYNGLWEIASFQQKNDAETAILTGEEPLLLENTAAYYVEIVPLNDSGILFVSNNGESYSSFKSAQAYSNDSNNILSDLFEATSSENWSEGNSTTQNKSNMIPYVTIGSLIIIAALGCTIYVIKRYKTTTSNL